MVTRNEYKRVVFNEITKRAITEAFDEPGELDMRYVEAQQARRFLDEGGWLYGVSLAVGEGCPGSLCGAGPVCCCSSGS